MDRETAIKTLGRWAIAAERRADQHEHDYEVDTRVSADGEIAAANRERTYAKTCLVIAEMLRHAAPVGEPAPLHAGQERGDVPLLGEKRMSFLCANKFGCVLHDGPCKDHCWVATWEKGVLDALDAKPETCGNCAHSDDAETSMPERETFCTLRGGFYNGALMLKGARCPDWAAK